MNRRLRVISTIFFAVALAILAAGAMKSATPDESTLKPAGQDWPQATGDIGNTRYSTLSQLNKDTVKNLGAAWVSEKFDDGAASGATPVVKDGMMFITAGAKVYALDPKTGKSIWKYRTTETQIGRVGLGPGPAAASGRGIPNTQGVVVADGKVFVGLTDAQMMALDEKTGKVIWRRSAGDDLTDVMRVRISATPVYANGAIYTALAFNEGRYIGRAVAMDATDGHVLWHSNTIPGPGEPGHETWGKDPKSIVWKMGGADIWLPPVVDPTLGLVYYGTGNPSPNRVGNVRPGNNLYSASVIALDTKTGKLRWYFQLTHHDLWEGDLATPMVLYDGQYNGSSRKGLAVLRADGTLFLLDRATGKPIFPVEERPVRQSALYATSPTQPYPVGGGSLIDRDCSQWKPQPGFILRCEYFQPPSDDPPNVLSYAAAGSRTSPMSYNPQTGYFYIQGLDRMQWEWNSPLPTTWEFTVSLFMTQRVPNIEKQGAMIFAAVDPRTYKVVWKKEMPTPPSNYGVGGFLTTAGGLAFHRMEDGNLVAYDAKTGDELWKFQTGLIASDTATPMSYEVDGQQYISVVELSQVWAFRLGGTLPQLAVPKFPTRDDILEGPVQDTQVIRATVPDDYNYKQDIGPLKARVKVGSPVTFTNNSAEYHTFEAVDGSWTTGLLLPRQTAVLTFDKPGTYLYHCKEHPYAYALLIVTDASASTTSAAPANGGGAVAQGAQRSFAAQATRGKDAYQQQCSLCHQPDMGGSDMIPALAGSGFLARWQGKTGKDLFDRTRTTMPSTSPGSLTPQTYMDLVAYILQANGVSQPNELSEGNLNRAALP